MYIADSKIYWRRGQLSEISDFQKGYKKTLAILYFFGLINLILYDFSLLFRAMPCQRCTKCLQKEARITNALAK